MKEERPGLSRWFDGCSIYQIYPRSFQDSNGDGNGDLEGIRRRLDHIVALGVGAVWISPFYPSPMKDFGYDVANYRDIDPIFGTLDDFRNLLAECHSAGLKVIIDQVWSHTSDQHPWFIQSRANGSNAMANWYVWADAKPDGSPPNNWLSVFGGPAWTWDSGRHQYYLHNFLASQPDLNFHNPQVQDAVLDIARFWFDLGVDGFRLDVCNFYFHSPRLEDNPVREDGWQGAKPHDWQAHVHCRSQPENLPFLARLRQLAESYGGRLLLGEIGDDKGMERQIEYTAGDRLLHMAYSFDLLTPDGSPERLHAILQTWLEAGEGTPVWAIGNHDVPRVATRWTGGQPDPAQLRMFAAFHACLPGPICIYQGEELGLEQVELTFEKLRDPEGIAMWPRGKGRDGCRTPMAWEAGRGSAGFSEAEETWLPLGAAHALKAADQQIGDQRTLLNLYRRLLAWRRDCPCVRTGSLALLETDPDILAWSLSDGEDKLHCVFNFSRERKRLDNHVADFSGSSSLFGEGAAQADEALYLDGYGWSILASSAPVGPSG